MTAVTIFLAADVRPYSVVENVELIVLALGCTPFHHLHLLRMMVISVLYNQNPELSKSLAGDFYTSWAAFRATERF